MPGTKSPISRFYTELNEFVEEVYYVACSQTGCTAEEYSHYDKRALFDSGWRVVDGEWVACPECVKKIREKLKKKK